MEKPAAIRVAYVVFNLAVLSVAGMLLAMTWMDVSESEASQKVLGSALIVMGASGLVLAGYRTIHSPN